MALLSCAIVCFAQYDSFENRLKLDAVHRNAMERWEFGTTSISCLSDELWEHLLPKSTLGNDKIILNWNELSYFLELDDIKIKTKTDPIANPEHWENRFGRQIRTITLHKPLTILGIKDDTLVQFSLDSLIGLRYHTFYPYGEFDIPDQGMTPIMYKQKNSFDEHSPVLLATSSFLERVDLDTAKVHRDTLLFGTEDFSGTLYTTGIDFNADGQDEVVMYHETIQDSWASEGDESESYTRSMIALYFKNKWYRTSYWQEGQDGIEGF